MTRRRTSIGPGTAADGGPARGTVRLVHCPQCGGDAVYAPSNPYRPFCSQRCKNIDFGAWADESFRVAESVDPENDPLDVDGRLQ